MSRGTKGAWQAPTAAVCTLPGLARLRQASDRLHEGTFEGGLRWPAGQAAAPDRSVSCRPSQRDMRWLPAVDPLSGQGRHPGIGGTDLDRQRNHRGWPDSPKRATPAGRALGSAASPARRVRCSKEEVFPVCRPRASRGDQHPA